MPIELKMPALSPSMEHGTVAKWLVAEGAWLKSGDLVAEIETDKATMEFEAEVEGCVSALMVAEGAENVAVGTVIALLVGEDEEAPTEPAPGRASASTAPAAGPASARKRGPSRAERVTVSPLAARIAARRGIDLAGKTGSGPNGRIVRADLGLAPLNRFSAPPAWPEVSVPTAARSVPAASEKLSAMRRTIAQRLGESKRTVPHFYLTVRCNIDPLLRLRRELNANLVQSGVKLSVNDFLMKAMATALQEVPDAHVQFEGDAIRRFQDVDVAMAVAIDGGLITPVIRGVDGLSLSAIARTSRTLAEQARSGQLSPDQYQGGSVSISNLGMYGVDEMIPIINPPQALILGIGAGVEQPWKVDGDIRLATILAATASFDHRAIDGSVGAQFLSSFRDVVQNPLRLVT